MKNRAIALQYQDLKELPRVVAMGYGEIAKIIVALAEKSGIPVEEDHELSSLLSQLHTGDHIQHESLRLVAELLCFLYDVDSEWREEHAFLGKLIDAPLSSNDSGVPEVTQE